MDEILHRTRPEVGTAIAETLRAEEPAEGLRAKARRVWSAVQAGALVLKRTAVRSWHKADCVLAGHKLMAPLPFLAVATVAAVALVTTTVYTPSYVVTVDGMDLGTVAEPAVFERVVERVEQRASDILGYDYTLDQEVEYTFVLTQKDKLSSVGAFETYLFNQVGEVMKSYVLTVDGRFIGAAADRAALNGMLEELAAPYVTENTVSVEYVEDVDISYQYISSDVLQDLVSMEEILSANTTGETTYEVVKGDTYLGIAYANDMSLDELMALNPQASLDRLMIGDILTVKKTIPYLSIRTVDAVTYTEAIACPVEEVEDSSMYVGDRKVLTAGTPGEALVSANVTYVNGYEEGRQVTSFVTLSEPTTEVVAVGTKARPKTMPTGTFQWPLSGRISSYFGYRSIFGSYSYHSGIDIATSYGKAIAAADGGTVIWSGYKGSYGNLVIIDHGNGVQSYYGHCSSLLVSAGDKVYKGQTIARVGSTGRSTGNHLHFEVKINGTSVNPLSYLP
ncbi:MAG: peptidoglycan DD-metalloendopeptidase family protein [Oscillospiraceae bacterium]